MRRRLSLLMVALLVVALLPAAAFARGSKAPAPRGIRPLANYPADAYETDDTSATAKAVPEVSMHTNPFLGADTADYDWFTFSAEATGEPFVIDSEYLGGVFDPYLTIYKANPDGTMTNVDPGGTGRFDDDAMFWTYASSDFFIAPAPGTYYGFYEQRDGDYGKYELDVVPGIARRLAGANRYETAVKVSKRMYGDPGNFAWGEDAGPRAIMVVNSNDAADAMTVGAFGWMYMFGDSEWPAPVLLTGRDSMPAVTKSEIMRLAQSQATIVYIVGGTDQVGQAQADMIESLAGVVDVQRIAGANRYATASLIASAVVENNTSAIDTVLIVSGTSWVDGLAAGPVAGSGDAPMLLTRKDALPVEAATWIQGNADITDAIIVGDPSAVDTAVADDLAALGLTVERVGGANRFETARLLAQYGVDNFGLDGDRMVLATGATFADGLAATPMTQMMNCPILLTKGTELSEDVMTFYMDNGPTNERSYIIGGEPTISEEVAFDFGNLWQMD